MKKIPSLMSALMAGVGLLAATATAAAPDFVMKESALWLDASTLTETAGTELESWTDVRGAGYKTATSYLTVKPQVIEIADGALAGKKAVTFFTAGTSCDMVFPRITGIKEVYFVVDIDQTQSAFWLGDTTYSFHRGTGGTYWYSNGYVDVNNTTYYNDGRMLSNPLGTLVPTGYQLVTYRRTGTSTGAAQWMTSDRGDTVNRVGGKRLCELIIFTREMSDVERSQVEGYLKYKWFGGTSQIMSQAEMLGHKAQVRFDASVASSFHYDLADDTTAVTQWDDLSGNGNHLTPYHAVSGTTNYGKVTTINTLPAYDLGAVGSHIEMQLTTRQTATRTIVFVGDIARSDIFWLGDSSCFRFHRGSAGQFAYQHSWNYLYTVGKVWQNGVRMTNLTGSYPDRPGGPTVFVLQIPANCEWCYLSNDRNATGSTRNGGKQVCELVTFGSDFSEADCVQLSNFFIEKWLPKAEDLIPLATLHVDASSRTNFNYTSESISGWKNIGTGADLTASVCTPYGSVVSGSWGYTNGVPAFKMGTISSGIDMGYTRLTDIQSVFWVMDIQRALQAFFLGDMSSYHFHRGTGGQYSGNYAGFRDGEQYCDGTRVTSPTTQLPPYGLHVYNVALAASCCSDRLSNDRNCGDSGTYRNGGRALSELIIFNRRLCGTAMIAIQNHLQQKWRQTSGWRADDGDWGAQNYRVFTADATVPEEGAAAEGIGVNANATISGGTLALGAGGVFAATGVTATVSAPLAEGSTVAANGPGTVVLTSAPTASSEITLECNATLTLPLYGSTTGRVLIKEGAKLIFDVSNLAADQHVALTMDALTLPDGANFADSVQTTDDAHHVVTLSADGKQILIDSPTVPLTATWVGAGDRANASDPANWECRNAAGEVIADAVPTAETYVTVSGSTSFNMPAAFAHRALTFDGNLTLTADCDWRGLGAVDLAGVTINLDGHKLYVTSITGAATITDGSAATAMKYFKLVIRKTYFGTELNMQFSEFYLNAADGTRQNLNLTDAGAVAASTLAAGTFTSEGSVNRTGNEGAIKIFDGNTGTKWCQGLQDLRNAYDDSAKWPVICMRLADDAQPIAAYNIYTANDCPCRQPSGWDLYASANGTDWTLIDRRKSLARLGTYYQPISASFPLTNAAPGELHFDVAEGQTFENTNVLLDGNLRLVKDGAGTYLASKGGQRYAGGTVVNAGTIKPTLNGGDFPFGAAGSTVTLNAGGTFDPNGKTGRPTVDFVLNGGTINSSVDGVDGACALGALNLACDTTISFPFNNGIGNGIGDLGGHTLTVNVGTSGKYFYVFNEAYDANANPYNEVGFTNGTLKIASGGYLKIWSHLDCRTVNFDIGSAMYMNWNTDVKDLIWRYGANYSTGSTGLFRVHGTFSPLASYFFRAEMQDGSTLDLSDKTEVWSTTSALVSNGTNYCTFKEGATITLDVHGRAFKTGDQIVSWVTDAAPTNVKFVLDASSAKAGRKLLVKSDGVYFAASGFVIFMR